jgi:hypothetical protein
MIFFGVLDANFVTVGSATATTTPACSVMSRATVIFERTFPFTCTASFNRVFGCERGIEPTDCGRANLKSLGKPFHVGS